MQKLPKLSGAEAIKLLARLGFNAVRQSGSHVILIKKTTDGKTGTVVPLHKELKIGTLKGILKKAQVDEEQFIKLVKK